MGQFAPLGALDAATLGSLWRRVIEACRPLSPADIRALADDLHDLARAKAELDRGEPLHLRRGSDSPDTAAAGAD